MVLGAIVLIATVLGLLFMRRSRWFNDRVNRFICSPHRQQHKPGCNCARRNGRRLAGSTDERGNPVWDTLVIEGSPNAPVILYCHGNKRTICSCSNMDEHFRSMYPACTVVYFDYQGFGASRDSDPSQPYSPRALSDDVISLLNLVRSEFHGRPIFIYAHSLGAMIVANIAPSIATRISGLILEGAPYLASDIIPWKLGGKFTGWLTDVDNKYPIAACLAGLPQEFPVLVMHSGYDRVVPCIHQDRHMRAFHERGASNVKALSITGPHNNAVFDSHTCQEVSKFMNAHQ